MILGPTISGRGLTEIIIRAGDVKGFDGGETVFSSFEDYTGPVLDMMGKYPYNTFEGDLVDS